MHALLTMRRAVALGAAVVILLLLGVAPAVGEYRTVAGPLQQWVWLRSEGLALTATAVRDDGWMVVATGRRLDSRSMTMIGGGLLLVPPWGGTAIPFGDPPSLVTKHYGYTSLVARGDRLFGLTSVPDETGTVGQLSELVELDARSGKVVAEHGKWWFPDLVVDPRTNDLVLWTFTCTGECDPFAVDVDDAPEEMTGTVTHDLVRYDPDTRKRTAVLVPDPMRGGPSDGSGTCASRRTSLHRCEEVFRLAFSPDGSTLFLGTARVGSNAVDVRDRDGKLRSSFAVPRAVDAMGFLSPSSCLAGTLLLTSPDGTAWAVPSAAEGAGAGGIAQVAAGAPAGRSDAAITPDGNVVTLRRSEAVLLSCPEAKRVEAPPLPAPPAPAAPVDAAAAAPAGGPPPPAPQAPSAPPAPPANPPPPVQPPSMPAVAGPASHATQAVTSAQVGLVDAHEEQPVYGLSASSRRVDPSLPIGVVGVFGAIGFATVAWFTIPDPRRRVARARNEVVR